MELDKLFIEIIQSVFYHIDILRKAGDIMGDFSILAIRIKELRTLLGMKQKEFAKFVGCTAATLSAYENGSKSPSLEIIKGIAEKCHVSIDWLCGLSENKGISGDMQTYSDIISALMAIEKKIKITCDSSRIMVYNKKISKFLGDWRGVVNLYSSGTIDDNLYNLWIAQQLELYNCEILSKDGSLETKDTPEYRKEDKPE